MTGRPLVVVGDALLDRDLHGRVERLCPDAPVPVVDDPVERSRPGGAGLAAALAAADGRDVVLVTALSGDDAGQELAELLGRAGVEVVDLGLEGVTPEKVRVRAADRSLLRLDRGGSQLGKVGPLTARARRALEAGGAVLVSDYGRGVGAEPELRAALSGLGRTPVVWDPHPRGPAPVPGVRLAVPNRSEAALFVPEIGGTSLAAVTARARALAERWVAAAVAVTMGERGALLVNGDGPPLVVPAVPAGQGADPCGAGDRFASSAAGSLADGALPSEAVTAAVAAAAAFVAAGGAAAAPLGPPEQAAPAAASRAADDVVGLVRARGGTVVATGGCFDLLHAGHVGLLTAARALGDCLVVCLNSDASVRRLKGPGRPLVGQADRAAVLLALSCVDAVALFDEDTPNAVLDLLRPDVFVKGGDYAGADLPESPLLAGWGGQVVVVPYLEGRSTSGLLEEVARRGWR